MRSACFKFVPNKATPVTILDTAQALAASSTSIASCESPQINNFSDLPYLYHFGL